MNVITADEARRLTADQVDEKDISEIQEIERFIIQAAKKRNNIVVINKMYKDSTDRFFSKLGYDVQKFCYGDDDLKTMIKWWGDYMKKLAIILASLVLISNITFSAMVMKKSAWNTYKYNKSIQIRNKQCYLNDYQWNQLTVFEKEQFCQVVSDSYVKYDGGTKIFTFRSLSTGKIVATWSSFGKMYKVKEWWSNEIYI